MNWANLLLKPVLPEIFLCTAALIILMIGAFKKIEKSIILYRLSLFAITVSLILQCWFFYEYPRSIYLFSNMLVVDSLSTFLKIAMYIATALVFLYSKTYLKARDLLSGEYCVLVLLSLFGMNILVSATHLLSLYLGLEILSLALYTLIALSHQSQKSIEAAIKYFILGALASGFLLYGISMVYGATSSLNLSDIAQHIQLDAYEPTLLMLGVVFIICAVAFKLSLAPFHMWIPDIYQGASMPITLLISAAPKLAAIGFVMRILAPLNNLQSDWQWMFIFLSILSMAIGNITAIAQTNIKRMLAYAAIAQMGFLSLGFLTGIANYGTTIFYMVTYVIMSLAAFGILLALSTNHAECETLEDLKGLNKRNRVFALLLLLTMFSMAGVPPLLGFYAKFSVISAIVHLQLPNTTFDLTGLAIYAVLMSAIAAFYYLRVVKYIYMDNPVNLSPIKSDKLTVSLLCLNALAILGFGIFPNELIETCADVAYKSLVLLQ